MLKIERMVDGEVVVSTLIGRLDDESLAQLESFIDGERQQVILDLQEVNLVSREAVRFLGHFEERGGGLENCQPYLREWINRERNGERGPDGPN
jgi:hypothetical protein